MFRLLMFFFGMTYCLSVSLPTCMTSCLSICLPLCPSLTACLSLSRPFFLPAFLSSFYLSPTLISTCLPVWNVVLSRHAGMPACLLSSHRMNYLCLIVVSRGYLMYCRGPGFLAFVCFCSFPIYLEYHSVCSLVGTRTSPPPLPQRVCPPLRNSTQSIYRSYTLCIWPDSEHTKFIFHPREGRGPQTDKHLPPIPLQVNFWEKLTFRVWCLFSYLVHVCTYIFVFEPTLWRVCL